MDNFISFLVASYPTLDHVLRHSSMHRRFIVSTISSLSQESLEASQSGWMYKSGHVDCGFEPRTFQFWA